jgi:hypothetical protein
LGNLILAGFNKNYNLFGTGGCIWLYSDENEIQINKETIESYKVIDTIENTVTQTSGTSTGKSRKGTTSMAVRGVVGGVLFGPVGAVVGASTAKRKSKVSTSSTSVTTATRTFKVEIVFKEGSTVLLQLDEVGYDNLLVALYSEPYLTYKEYCISINEEKAENAKRAKKGYGYFGLWLIQGAIWGGLFHNGVLSFVLATIGTFAIPVWWRKHKEKKVNKLSV